MLKDGSLIQRPPSAGKTEKKMFHPLFQTRSRGMLTEEEKKQRREEVDQLRLNNARFITTIYLQRLAETYPLKTVLEEHVVTISWHEQKKRIVVTFSPR